MLTAAALVVGLVPVFAGNSPAHPLPDGQHWNRFGSSVDIYVGDIEAEGCRRTKALGTKASNEALGDIFYNPHPVNLWCVDYHTDIVVWEANEPELPACGLASVSKVATNVAGHWHITHGHARVNTASHCPQDFESKRGIYCQEISHTLGLQHSNTGDCMAFGYFSGSSKNFGSTGQYVYDFDHNTDDLYSQYRNTHH